MKIALIGYGKMGKAIETIALDRGHQISFKIHSQNANELLQISPNNTDVAIEFTTPHTAVTNIQYCLSQRIPIVVGSTGWLPQFQEMKDLCKKQQGALFYASNFSLGVNLFFKLNEHLATLMNAQDSYHVSIEEVHHTEKKDAPSGTGITLAEGILNNIARKDTWKNEPTLVPSELQLISKREPDVPGTHTVCYSSDVDTIEIKHTAHSRKGFAEGAVLASEWIQGKTGIFGMDDLLNIK